MAVDDTPEQEAVDGSVFGVTTLIQKAVVSIPFDRLRLILADNAVSMAETRAALRQTGLSEAQIEANIEVARQTLSNYAMETVPPEQRLSNGLEIQALVDAQKSLIRTGLLDSAIGNTETAAHRISEDGMAHTPGMEREKDGKSII